MWPGLDHRFSTGGFEQSDEEQFLLDVATDVLRTINYMTSTSTRRSWVNAFEFREGQPRVKDLFAVLRPPRTPRMSHSDN